MNKEKFYSGGFLYKPKTNSVLLHKRDARAKVNPDRWAFFGGLNEEGELPEETFVREISEELGIKISKDKIIPLCDYFNEELQTHRNIFFIESDLDKSEMKLGEGEDFDWISLDKVFEYDLTEKTAKDLKVFIGHNFIQIIKMNLKDTYNKTAVDYFKDHKEDNWWKEGADKFIGFLKKGDIVLDVGCGTGIKAKYLIEKGLDVLGVDFSDKCIEIAKRETPRGNFIVVDIMDNLKNINGTFDGLFAQASLLHISKKEIENVLKKLLTKLKDGGYFYIALKEKKIGRKDEEIVVDNDYGYEYERFFSYFTMDEIKNYLNKLGLKICYENYATSGKAPWIQVIAKKEQII